MRFSCPESREDASLISDRKFIFILDGKIAGSDRIPSSKALEQPKQKLKALHPLGALRLHPFDA